MAQTRYDNSTNYEHPQESNLLNIHKSMEYNVLGQPIIRTTLGPTASDAFGRFRVGQPFTLFDSSHRYNDNGRFNTNLIGVSSTATHQLHSGSMILSIGTESNALVYRESNRVFAYQPGKSLMILQTFVMGDAIPGKRTRAGYFDKDNGHYLERNGSDINFVRRTTSLTGVMSEIRIPKDQWNINRLDGTDASKITLNLDTAQILYTEIEWLGVGTVTQGFVISGQFVPCHKWDWANETGSTATYMATACLPVRLELENTTTTTATSVLKEICASVISEGGYELRGKQRSGGTPVSSPYALPAKDIVYPIFSMRLKSSRLGGIVLPKNYTIGVDKAANYRYTIVSGAITTGGTWTDGGANSSVEYKINATSLSGGTITEIGYINASNQSSISPSLAAFPFSYQLERNTFLNTGTEFTVCIETDSSTGPNVWCSINWEELT